MFRHINKPESHLSLLLSPAGLTRRADMFLRILSFSLQLFFSLDWEVNFDKDNFQLQHSFIRKCEIMYRNDGKRHRRHLDICLVERSAPGCC